MTDKKNNFYILFILTVLISGSGWIFVRMQLKYIPPDLAVCYRFFLAGMALLLFSWARGEKFQKFPLKKLPWLCGFGFSLYYLSTVFSYKAVAYLPSGVVAMGLSMLMIPGSLLDSLWHKKPIQKTVIVGGFVSLIGLLFALDEDNSFASLEISMHEMAGLGFIFLCLSAGAVGSLFVTHIKRLPLTTIQGTAYGLLTGASLNAFFYWLSGREFVWVWDGDFLLSMAYLSFLLSGVSFTCQNYLIQEWGVGKASYSFVFMPLVAMNVSVWFEGMEWTLPRLLGMCLVLLTGVFVLRSNQGKSKRSQDMAHEPAP